MNTFLEIHLLQNFAPSNLNRDDTGAPKEAFFGGIRRGRISSQCSKRAVRGHFRTVLGADDTAVRTRLVLDALVKILVQKGRERSEASEKARMALAGMKLPIKDDGKSEYLLFLGKRELAGLADAIDSGWDKLVVVQAEAGTRKGKKTKKEVAGAADPELRQSLEAVFNGGKAVDVALFGRMLADMPEKNRDAACQVAHSISTHAVNREFDFYTAVDDLQPLDTAGAGMMDTVEFNSACYYRYAVIDWDKLVANLQDDRDLAAIGVRAFLEGFVLAEPTGKQNSFAAHNPPEFAAVSVRRQTSPRNLANAFETPVRPGHAESLTRRSANALVEKALILNAAFGGDGTTLVLDLTGAKIDGFGRPVTTLKELLDGAVAALAS